VILERRKTKELSRLALARFANKAQRAAGLRGEVNILLTGDAEMRRLNLQFRRKDKPTDVLSFPTAPAGSSASAAGSSASAAGSSASAAGSSASAAGSAALPDSAAGGGDIAISLAAARAQAVALGHDLLTEAKVLILHGMLHLAGHDHECDHGEMLRLETKLRDELHLNAGLIERTLIRGATPTRKPTGKPTRKRTGGSAARTRRPE
jgi:probable rRNA maturation factor